MGFFTRLGRLVFVLLTLAGGASGLFLLLCAGGYLDPSALFPGQREGEGMVAASAPVIQEGEDEPFQGVYLPVEAIDQALFLSGGCDGVIVPMKTEEGELGYVSSLPLAADWGASSGDPERNGELWELNTIPHLHTVALVSCLRDGLALQAPHLTLQRPSGSPWLDESGTPWLDPAQPQVGEYLIGVCRELALLGFDEILLTHCAYPDPSDLAGEEDRDRAAGLEAFCRQLQGALADLPVELSVLGEGDALQTEAPSGQTAALLASFPGGVWAEREDREALAAFSPTLFPVK